MAHLPHPATVGPSSATGVRRRAALDRHLSIEDLRRAAKRRLPRGVFNFIDLGAEDNLAMQANLAAFARIKLRTRFLTDISNRDTGVELLGKKSNLPLVIGPTGFAGLCWYEGDLALARAAAVTGVPFTLCAHSNASMEAVAAIGGRPWIQVQLWRDLAHSRAMIEHAANLGFEAVVITIDSGPGRNREHNKRSGFEVPFVPSARPIVDMLLHPRWLTSVVLRYLASGGMPRHVNFPEGFRKPVTQGAGPGVTSNPSATWSDLKSIRQLWKRALIVKGILSAHDAEAAVQCGADAIVVSNHGGRALDSAAASLDLLPEIVQAVGGRCTILIDGGVRRGSDIVKALALGADAVLVGRPTLWGVSVAGQAGAEQALRILASEFAMTMGFVGCREPREIDASLVFSR